MTDVDCLRNERRGGEAREQGAGQLANGGPRGRTDDEYIIMMPCTGTCLRFAGRHPLPAVGSWRGHSSILTVSVLVWCVALAHLPNRVEEGTLGRVGWRGRDVDTLRSVHVLDSVLRCGPWATRVRRCWWEAPCTSEGSIILTRTHGQK